MIVLDTNVLFELIRPQPDPGVVAWAARQPASLLFTTTVTQAEILYGVALLPADRRRDSLAAAVEGLFGEDFAGRVLSFDPAAAAAFAEIAADRRRAGRAISQFDAQIAAVARSRRARLATRNRPDFEGCGVVLVDPWAAVG